MERTKKLWVKCTPEEHKRVKAMAKEKGLSVSDMVLSNLLGIEIIPLSEPTKTPYVKVVNTKGDTKTYYKEYKRKKKGVLKPVPEVT
ncbi:MAG TPA: hypothetical protein PL110_06455 [Candidatus Eremiobacteraeota bacterium]|nr:hypothetical protein [Candidatus Eremiobacteraeota bacterium]